MGTWQLGPFDNDGAADFLAEAEEALGRSVTRRAARGGVGPKASDDRRRCRQRDVGGVRSGGAGVRAAGDDSATAGRRRPGGADRPTEAMRERALAALDRVADVRRSELAQRLGRGRPRRRRSGPS
ncbi:MAG: DUF4259 domain-containing protein [Myxococcales bacterium]|nr:DUF4259 domain-containing protein [Myxococcales bacterium]